MSYSIDGYNNRAEECVRLANSVTDEMLKRDILRLRQSYSIVARELKRQLQAEDSDARPVGG